MNHYIVIEDSNYADEFDLEGMRLYESDKELKDFKEEVFSNIELDFGGKYPFEAYFGTNEQIEITSRKDLESLLKIKNITEEEYKVIKKVLGTSFGLSSII